MFIFKFLIKIKDSNSDRSLFNSNFKLRATSVAFFFFFFFLWERFADLPRLPFKTMEIGRKGEAAVVSDNYGGQAFRSRLRSVLQFAKNRQRFATENIPQKKKAT
jgi:hypothetical protein